MSDQSTYLPTAFGKQPFHKNRKTHRNFVNRTASGTVNKLFNKTFQFDKDGCTLTLPEPTKTFEYEEWLIHSLQVMKTKLNFDKSQLDNYPIDDWSVHTRKRNIAGDVRWRLRTSVNPEFLTQAWTKFYECVSKFEVVPTDIIVDKQFNSLHLCEAPGAFIASLNHYIKVNHKELKWDWLASTLNPYYEGNSLSSMICDDRFIFHTLEKWEFGIDNTGDIMNWNNSQAIIKRAGNMGDVHLVTADGSIDCMMNPAEQEGVVASLHYCEVITALQVLVKGGTFICKFFTIFEHPAICILYLLNVLFEKVSMFKPATSKEGNSEVYLICLKYTGKDVLSAHLPHLRKGYGTELFKNRAMFSKNDIPNFFMTKVKKCANYFSKLQRTVIDHNILSYDNPNNGENFRHLKSLKQAVAQNFITQYNVKKIAIEDEILKGESHNEQKANLNPRILQGSYVERINFKHSPKVEKLEVFRKELEGSVKNWPFMKSLEWVTLHGHQIKFSFIHGKGVDKLNSSKFINASNFKLFTEIRDLCSLKPEVVNSCGDEEFQELIEVVKFDPQNVTYLKLDNYDIFNNFEQNEKINFDTLYNKLRCLRTNDSIVISNFCLLSHFSVGVLFLLACKLFNKVGFCENGLIILHQLINQTKLGILDAVVKEWMACKNSDNDPNRMHVSVLGVLPVQLLESGTFYSTVIEYNNNLIKRLSKKYIDKCLLHQSEN